MSESPVPNWIATNLRLTGFLVPGVESRLTAEPGWWELMVGEPPDNKRFQSKDSIRIDSGRFAESLLSCRRQTARFDWTLAPIEDPNVPDIADLGPWPSASEKFITLAKRWLQSPECPPLQRLAWGVNLKYQVADVPSGYAELQNFLRGSVKLDPESTDFTYRINRPRPFKNAWMDLSINRLSTWLVSRTLVVSVPPTEHGQERFDRVLELDISTDATRRSLLEPIALTVLLDELFAFSLEIATKGDVK